MVLDEPSLRLVGGIIWRSPRNIVAIQNKPFRLPLTRKDVGFGICARNRACPSGLASVSPLTFPRARRASLLGGSWFGSGSLRPRTGRHVSGILVLRVGRLRARASNCRPPTFSLFAPRDTFPWATAGSLCCVPIAKVSMSLVASVPSCAPSGRGTDQKDLPVPHSFLALPRNSRGARVRARGLGCGKLSWHGTHVSIAKNGHSVPFPNDSRARPGLRSHSGAGRCVSRFVREECYLVDPASSHMLVSKIKPCMCKYELIQTVKLRMAH
jgi:hypothetical protein